MTELELPKVTLMLGAAGGLVLLAPTAATRLRDLLEDFVNGPRPPSHPLPAKEPSIRRRKSV